MASLVLIKRTCLLHDSAWSFLLSFSCPYFSRSFLANVVVITVENSWRNMMPSIKNHFWHKTYVLRQEPKAHKLPWNFQPYSLFQIQRKKKETSKTITGVLRIAEIQWTNRTPTFLESIESNNNTNAQITNNYGKSPNSRRIEHKKEIATAMAGQSSW